MDKFFHDIQVKDRIRDPLYGFILLTDSEKKIIDTPIFQRLRRIHQLALTKYVYPSAEHSRFVHSLGVMHCATLILSGIFDNKNSDPDMAPQPKMVKTLRLAALLHDIGHLPFSHAAEKEWLGSGIEHEDLSCFIIQNYKPIRDIMESERVAPADVAAIIQGNFRVKHRLLHEIVSGHLDVDRADYLLRDSHCCGVRYGDYDFSRFLQMFAVQEEDDSGLILGINEADIHVAESLLIARYHYNMQVPYHRTRSGYDRALRRFVREIDDYKDIFQINPHKQVIEEIDFERFIDLDDYQIMERAKSASRKNDPWAGYLLRAKHLIPLIDSRNTWDNGLEYKNARTLLENNGWVEGEDFFIQDDRVTVIKTPEVEQKKSNTPDEKNKETDSTSCPPENKDMKTTGLFKVICKGSELSNQCVDITERSWIIKRLAEQPEIIYRIFVTEEKKEAAKKVIEMK